MNIRQNCLFVKATRFSAAPILIEEEYKNTPFCSENWSYPYLYYGEPRSEFYAEVFTSGMDYTLDYWFVFSKNYDNPKALHFCHFPDNDKVINRIDMEDLLLSFLSSFSGIFKPYYYEITYYLKEIVDTKPKINGYIKYCFGNNSQNQVILFINNKFIKEIKE